MKDALVQDQCALKAIVHALLRKRNAEEVANASIAKIGFFFINNFYF